MSGECILARHDDVLNEEVLVAEAIALDSMRKSDVRKAASQNDDEHVIRDVPRKARGRLSLYKPRRHEGTRLAITQSPELILPHEPLFTCSSA